MLLGENINVIRRSWKLKQSEFGDLLDLPSHRIGSYESGENSPRILTLLKLEEITGIPIYKLCNTPIDRADIPQGPLKEYSPLNTTVESTPKSGDNNPSEIVLELQQKLIAMMEENRALRQALDAKDSEEQ